jgi:hypothetical protein
MAIADNSKIPFDLISLQQEYSDSLRQITNQPFTPNFKPANKNFQTTANGSILLTQ